ncbi:BRI1-associated receptor kinase [Artemisia annua]|uniref:BRI1-associated receptor kinase n=1 Tax=Artemisia annua TaxID=35608 RepID=A0A2U1MRR3_ARTAN|nr:BRI1-associated receptor kinase [Artemisia annua]
MRSTDRVASFIQHDKMLSDLSSNNLRGDVPVNGSFSVFTPIRLYFNIMANLASCSFGGNPNLRLPYKGGLGFVTETNHLTHLICKMTSEHDSRLNNNTLTGTIPILLTTITSLQVLDLSSNNLRGDVPVNGSFSIFTPIRLYFNIMANLASCSFGGNPNLRLPYKGGLGFVTETNHLTRKWYTTWKVDELSGYVKFIGFAEILLGMASIYANSTSGMRKNVSPSGMSKI